MHIVRTLIKRTNTAIARELKEETLAAPPAKLASYCFSWTRNNILRYIPLLFPMAHKTNAAFGAQYMVSCFLLVFFWEGCKSKQAMITFFDRFRLLTMYVEKIGHKRFLNEIRNTSFVYRFHFPSIRFTYKIPDFVMNKLVYFTHIKFETSDIKSKYPTFSTCWKSKNIKYLILACSHTLLKNTNNPK